MNLEFQQKPNYTYLSNILLKILKQNKYELDYNFDWVEIFQKNKEYL